jgi:hypothetical protein
MFLKRVFSFVLGSYIALSPLAGEQLSQKNKMLMYVDTIHTIFDSKYAPTDWKKEYCNWDIGTRIKKLKEHINKNDSTTLKNFHILLTELFNSAKDYHTRILFASSESAFLPFAVKGVNGKYFVVSRNKKALPNTWNVGDELVLFDGKPVSNTIDSLYQLNKVSCKELDYSKAETMLTLRLGALGNKIPKGPVVVGLIHKGSKEISYYQLVWEYTPELVIKDLASTWAMTSENDPLLIRFARGEILGGLHVGFGMDETVQLKNILKKTGFPNVEAAMSPFDDPKNPNVMGAQKSFLPPLGEKIWEKPGTYHAYLFKDAKGRKIGYIRIPHYMPQFNAEVEEFGKRLNEFQEQADALVIDQLNNYGGMAWNLNGICSMLTDKPMYSPQEHVKLNQEDVLFAIQLLSELSKITDDKGAVDAIGADHIFGLEVNLSLIQMIRHYCQFVIDQWAQGKAFTDATFLIGNDQIMPHSKYRFTKPLLVLINGLDVSCGDFFPAIMQDNKRATLFGTTTSGAGGAVYVFSTPNSLGIYRAAITQTIAERLDGRPIENLGVKPDIEYALTENDILNNYVDYVNAVNEAIDTIIK